MNFNALTDEPLENDFEDMMDSVGPKVFLNACIEKFGVNINMPIEKLSDYECRKICRAIYRNAADYRGTIQ